MDIKYSIDRIRQSLDRVRDKLSGNREVRSPEQVFSEPSELGIDDLEPDEGALGSEEITADDLPKREDSVTPEELPSLDDESEDLSTEIPTEEPEEQIDLESGLEEPEPEVEAPEVPEEPVEPEERKWETVTPVSQDMKQISFKANDGFYLDMKKIEAVKNMWLARLYKEKPGNLNSTNHEYEILDNGQVFIPDNIHDPISYIQELASAMLDKTSMRYAQERLKSMNTQDVSTESRQRSNNLLLEVNEKSWMIAFYPDKESIKKISKIKDIIDLPDSAIIHEPKHYHVTLRFWEEHKDLKDKIIEILNNSSFKSITCEVVGLEILGDDALVLMLKSDQLNNIQKKLDSSIKKVGIPPSDYKSFKAHITIATRVSRLPKEKISGMKFKLDKVKLVNNFNTKWVS